MSSCGLGDQTLPQNKLRDSRMRICFAVETYPTVTETFVYEPVDWLERAGHHVAVVAAVRKSCPTAMASGSCPARSTRVGDGECLPWPS